MLRIADQTLAVRDEAGVEPADAADALIAELERLMGEGPWLAGAEFSLADIMLAPVLAYLQMTPEAASLMAERPGLSRWWQAMAARPSMATTAPSLG